MFQPTGSRVSLRRVPVLPVPPHCSSCAAAWPQASHTSLSDVPVAKPIQHLAARSGPGYHNPDTAQARPLVVAEPLGPGGSPAAVPSLQHRQHSALLQRQQEHRQRPRAIARYSAATPAPGPALRPRLQALHLDLGRLVLILRAGGRAYGKGAPARTRQHQQPSPSRMIGNAPLHSREGGATLPAGRLCSRPRRVAPASGEPRWKLRSGM